MSRYLFVLIWPAGIAAILGAAFVIQRPAPGAGHATTRDWPRSVPGRHDAQRVRPAGAIVAWGQDASLLAAAIAGVAVLAYAVMALLGLLVVHHGSAIDVPIYHWAVTHRVRSWAAVMDRLTKLGDTWTTWGAAAAAAVCLAVASPRLRWLAPALFAAAIVVDHYVTLALRHTFHRLGPPGSPLGTYPSGGCDRAVFLYGLIAYLLWREFSGTRRGAVMAAAAVAILGFNEAYSRVYLTLHWFTDALSGLLYGGLLLAGFIAAVRVTAGPPAAAGQPNRRHTGSARPAPAATGETPP